MKNAKDNENCGCSKAADTNPAEAALAAATPVSENPAGIKPVHNSAAMEEKSLQPKSLLASDSVTYGYDSRGRLHTVTFANSTVVTYSYDACGNRTSVVTTCPGGTC